MDLQEAVELYGGVEENRREGEGDNPEEGLVRKLETCHQQRNNSRKFLSLRQFVLNGGRDGDGGGRR